MGLEFDGWWFSIGYVDGGGRGGNADLAVGKLGRRDKGLRFVVFERV